MRVTRVFFLTFMVVLFSSGLDTAPCCCAAELAEAAAKDVIINDWMLQDHGKDTGKCFTDDKGAEVEARMVTTVLRELSADAAKPLQTEMDKLVDEKTPGNNPASVSTWNPLQMPTTGPPSAANAVMDCIIGENRAIAPGRR